MMLFIFEPIEKLPTGEVFGRKLNEKGSSYVSEGIWNSWKSGAIYSLVPTPILEKRGRISVVRSRLLLLSSQRVRVTAKKGQSERFCQRQY